MNNIASFSEIFNNHFNGPKISFTDEILKDIGIYDYLTKDLTYKEIERVALHVSKELIPLKNTLDYIHKEYGDYDITDTAYNNIRKYSYLSKSAVKIKNRVYILKTKMLILFLEIILLHYHQKISFLH